jgi:tRNA A-37 threonylcarbamoyl transferase component Bud32
MRETLGEKIGEGATADVHAWAQGQVLKLFKTHISPRFARHEARMTRAAFAAGAPAPKVLDEVTIEGRSGFVMPRFEGPTLRELLLTQAVTPEQMGTLLATLYIAVHKTPALPDVPSLRDWMGVWSRQPGCMLPKDIASGVLALIERLPPGDVLCHTDLHGHNVIMTADGPRIIDWAGALRADAVIDIGRAHVSLSEIVPEDADPAMLRTINKALQSEYARLAGISPAELTTKMEPYLPILRALVILQRRPMTLAQRERLIQRIAAALLSEG